MREKWKPVVGYESTYEVSNLGNVRRITVNTKLSEGDVIFAKQLRTSGLSYGELAKKFGVTRHAIKKAINYVYKTKPLRQRNRLLSPCLNSHGYSTVMLCVGGNSKTIQNHILVMRAFVGPPPEGCEINHKNGIRSDPRLENLEYISHAGNCSHAYAVLGVPGNAQKGEANGCAKLTTAQVLSIRELHLSGMRGAHIAKQFGVTRDAIYLILKRKNWKHV